MEGEFLHLMRARCSDPLMAYGTIACRGPQLNASTATPRCRGMLPLTALAVEVHPFPMQKGT